MKLITCESVFRGHPDKVCDQISDAILDACLEQDKNSRVAVECAIKNNQVWVFGEVTTNANVDFDNIAHRVLRDIGYKEPFTVWETISKQSNDIALGVDKEGAGDQGMMYGYAEEGGVCMPHPLVLAREISMKVEELRRNKYKGVLKPDGKCQVTMEYDDNWNLKRIDTIVVSTQTAEGVTQEQIRDIIVNEVLSDLIYDISEIKILVNPTGAFVVGGPWADSGLTGRKIIVDTYGGVAHHGGGAFSGKDPSKVDRSGAYYCRYVAKSLVVAGLCKKCEVGVSYSIGVAEPVSITVDSFGTGICSDEELVEIVKEHFDFKPASIRRELKLDSVKYEPLAAYGHMGREDIAHLPWEDVYDKAEEISKG